MLSRAADDQDGSTPRHSALTAVVESQDLLHLILLLTAEHCSSSTNPQDVAINVRRIIIIAISPHRTTQLMGVCKQWEHMAKNLPVWQTMEWARIARKSHRQPETPTILFNHLQRWWGGQLKTFAAQGCPVTCELLTDLFCSVLAKHAPRLEALRLRSCYRITDTGLRALAQAAPPLKHLELTWCGPAITANGLLAIAARAPGVCQASFACLTEPLSRV